MSETARLLRWFVPGALFLLLYGAWFLLDSNLSGRAVPEINAGTVAILGGSAIPIGFVIGMIAAEITWWPWRKWWLQTIDYKAVAKRIPGRTHICDLECLAGIVDVRVHEAYVASEQPHALRRVRSLTDLYQGLGHGSVAAALVFLLIVATVLVTSVWPGDEPLGGPRAVLFGVSAETCLALAWGMRSSHRRVIRIAEAMASDVLARHSGDDD